jgi:hypothetical protein
MNIPENNLAYPVLIEFSTGQGSGFLLLYGEDEYFITAKHVLFDQKTGLLRANQCNITCQTEKIDDDSVWVYDINLELLNKNKQVFQHKTADVAAFKFAKVTKNTEGNNYSAMPIEGVSARTQGNGTTIIALAKSATALLKDVHISNDIFVYGYPSSLGLKDSPQFDYNKPLLRKGIVANIYKKAGTIILDCPVYPGNSGGPVVQVTPVSNSTKHLIIGVVSQFIPYTENWKNLSNGLVHTELSNSGYSVVVAMDYVFEMLSIPLA